MPLHWIYSQDKIKEIVGKDSTAFFPTHSCPFYKYPLGVFSPYGAEGVALIRSVSKVGALDTENLSAEYFDYFSTYDQEGDKGYVGRVSHVPKQFVEGRKAGKSWSECSIVDSQAHGIAKVPVIVARYAGSPELSSQIERMVRVLQDSDVSVECSILVGKILERILLTNVSPALAVEEVSNDESLTAYQRNLFAFLKSGEKIRELVRFAKRVEAAPPVAEDGHRNMRVKGAVSRAFITGITLEEAVNTAKYAKEEDAEFAKSVFEIRPLTAKEPSAEEFALAVGMSCALPDALLNVLYVWKNARTLQEAVEMNTLMGGDNCSRILAIAAGYGASAMSEDVLPRDWMEKTQTELWNEVREAADKIAAANVHLHN
eukprot:CAMPEP_0173140028 /NCGR_PEP_ID=MMETSP1105-20130129/4625_1 /TAXON_ID=2985 /ORGANISM="Ochromonas sp., Strain BG-1" /LENGTH=372 /DNA_ID=CAMNT_0014052903 /DNA_START=88 /DNA_END=1206 /DNA_ORIENTATION=-